MSREILSFVELSRQALARAPQAPLARDTASMLDEIVALLDDSDDPVLAAKLSILLHATIQQMSLMLHHLQ